MRAEVLRTDDPVTLPQLGNTGRLWAAVLDVRSATDATRTMAGLLRAPQRAGTRRAVDPTQHVAVDLDGRVGTLPRPDLLGALAVKSCAAAGDHTRVRSVPSRRDRPPPVVCRCW